MQKFYSQKSDFDFVLKYFTKLTNHNLYAQGLIDDVAVIKNILVNTDTTIEGIHIVANLPPNFISYKAMARSFSDVFAKGGKPIGYFLNIILPKQFLHVETLVEGFYNFSQKYNVDLLGGDTSTHNEDKIIIIVTVLAKYTKNLARQNVQSGSDVYINKTIGSAFLGYHDVLRGDFTTYNANEYLMPTINELTLKKYIDIDSSMDISDGLITDLIKMAQASKKQFVIDYNNIPFAAGYFSNEMKKQMLSFGDDYNIVVTSKQIVEGFTKIGSILDGDGLVLENCPFVIQNTGYTHF